MLLIEPGTYLFHNRAMVHKDSLAKRGRERPKQEAKTCYSPSLAFSTGI